MTPDPYKVLKVPRNASKDTIKRAYRKRAIETHPDRGGSKEDCQRVQSAYLVLIGDVARKRFDETGDASAPKNEVADMATILSQAFTAAVNGTIDANRDITTVDIVSTMRTVIEKASDEVKKALKRLNSARKHLRRAKGRFKRQDADTLFETIIDAQLLDIEKNLTTFEAAAEVNKSALKYLDGCEFEFQAPPTVTMRMHAWPTSTTATSVQ